MPQLADTRAKLQQAREQHLREDTPLRLSKPMLKRAVAATRTNAGQGPDQVSKQLAQLLPEAGWDDLVRLLQVMLDTGLLPLQCMWSIV